MIPLPKYQDNPAPASVKAGASPFRSLAKNWCRIEEYLEKEIIRKVNEKVNLYLLTRGQEMGSTVQNYWSLYFCKFVNLISKDSASQLRQKIFSRIKSN